MFKKILAPIRGAREDAVALEVGLQLASRFGARLEVLYAAPLNTASITIDTAESEPADEVTRLQGTEVHRTALALFSEHIKKATSVPSRRDNRGVSARFSAGNGG